MHTTLILLRQNPHNEHSRSTRTPDSSESVSRRADYRLRVRTHARSAL